MRVCSVSVFKQKITGAEKKLSKLLLLFLFILKSNFLLEEND